MFFLSPHEIIMTLKQDQARGAMVAETKLKIIHTYEQQISVK